MTGSSPIFKWQQGETLGDTFLLKERLGRGTYGVVGRAVRLKDGDFTRRGDVVALKVPFDQELGEENLKREPDIMRRFSHPNIVRPYGYHNIAGLFVIEMELVQGRSLSQILDSKTLAGRRSLGTVLGWIRQVVLALQSMGEFAHGDIKPQNILVRDDGIVKLVDFGTSRRLEGELAVFTRGHGTEEYMAPEVALDGKRVSVKSDLYSVGVVLYEIATGDIPFHSSFERLAGKEMIKPREHNASIPVSLEKVILRVLERDPDMRYPNWQAFLADLDAAIAEIQSQGAERADIPETHRYEFNPEPSSPLYYLDRAKKALASGNDTEALRYAQIAVDTSDRHPNYLRMLAAICARLEYYDRAKEAFSQLLEKYDQGYPADLDQIAYVLRRLGELQIKTHEYDRAIRTWERFAAVSLDKTLAKYKLAVAYGLDGQYHQAIRLLERVRGERPDLVVVYSKLGWAYALAGDYRQALSYYNQALVIEPADLFSLFELGKYYRIMGDQRRATKCFEKIEKYDWTGEYVDKVKELYE